MNDFTQWAERYPEAAQDLIDVINGAPWNDEDPGAAPRDEAGAQQQVRFNVARQGGMAWRNNVGATPASEVHACPFCSNRFTVARAPVRYGLANDSAKLNQRIKSSDLILAIPRLITPDMVGQKIAQFGSLEVKRPGWKYTGKGTEPGQAAWIALIQSLGGFAQFTTGEVKL